jgi:ferredoxin
MTMTKTSTELTVVQPAPPEELRHAVLLAVTSCPTHALSIQEDD